MLLFNFTSQLVGANGKVAFFVVYDCGANDLAVFGDGAFYGPPVKTKSSVLRDQLRCCSGWIRNGAPDRMAHQWLHRPVNGRLAATFTRQGGLPSTLYGTEHTIRPGFPGIGVLVPCLENSSGNGHGRTIVAHTRNSQELSCLATTFLWTHARYIMHDNSRYQAERQAMHFGVDGKGQTYIEWEIGPGAWKRAWIQDRSTLGPVKDWAGTGRYLNVVRVDAPHSGPGGQATDFPIHSQGSDRQILRAFMFAVSAATGAVLPDLPI